MERRPAGRFHAGVASPRMILPKTYGRFSGVCTRGGSLGAAASAGADHRKVRLSAFRPLFLRAACREATAARIALRGEPPGFVSRP